MKDTRINWTLPAQPLGPAIKPQAVEKRDEIAEFNEQNHQFRAHPDGGYEYIPEADCRQIKSRVVYAASAQRSDVQAAIDKISGFDQYAIGGFAPVPAPSAAPVFKVGDRVRVTRENAGHYPIGAEGVVTFISGHTIYANMDNGPPGVYWTRDWLELAPPEAASGSGWIEHDGKSIPSLYGALIRVRFVGGSEYPKAERAPGWDGMNWIWRDAIKPWHIVAYRIVSQP